MTTDITKRVQEGRKKDQECKDLYWFTLPQGLCPVIFQQVKSSTDKDHEDQFTQYKTLATRKQPLLPVANSLLHPTTIVQTMQNPLHRTSYNLQTTM